MKIKESLGKTAALAALLIFLSSMAAAPPAAAYPDGPPNLMTWCGNQGADQVCNGGNCNSCTMCHASFGGPNSGDGQVSIQNLPTAYQAGAQYILAVLLEDGANPDFVIGGFEVSALQAGGGLCQAGDLMADEVDTRVDNHSGTNTQWLKHSNPQDVVGGSAMWQFLWTAPDPAVGDVVFNVCGNAANDADGPGGDRIYCSEFTVAEEQVALPEPEVMARRTASGLEFSWTGSGDGFNLYRGPLEAVGDIVSTTGAYQQAVCDVPASPVSDPAPAMGTGQSFFYLVVPHSGLVEQSYGCSDLTADGACDQNRLAASPACQ